jgi:hypothetical protein
MSGYIRAQDPSTPHQAAARHLPSALDLAAGQERPRPHPWALQPRPRPRHHAHKTVPYAGRAAVPRRALRADQGQPHGSRATARGKEIQPRAFALDRRAGRGDTPCRARLGGGRTRKEIKPRAYALDRRKGAARTPMGRAADAARRTRGRAADAARRTRGRAAGAARRGGTPRSAPRTPHAARAAGCRAEVRGARARKRAARKTVAWWKAARGKLWGGWGGSTRLTGLGRSGGGRRRPGRTTPSPPRPRAG